MSNEFILRTPDIEPLQYGDENTYIPPHDELLGSDPLDQTDYSGLLEPPEQTGLGEYIDPADILDGHEAPQGDIDEGTPAIDGLKKFVLAVKRGWTAGRLASSSETLEKRMETDAVILGAPESAQVLRSFGGKVKAPEGLVELNAERVRQGHGHEPVRGFVDGLNGRGRRFDIGADGPPEDKVPVTFLERRTARHREKQSDKIVTANIEKARLSQIYQPIPKRRKLERENFETIDDFRHAKAMQDFIETEPRSTAAAGWISTGRVTKRQRKAESKAIQRFQAKGDVASSIQRSMDRGSRGDTIFGHIRAEGVDRSVRSVTRLERNLEALRAQSRELAHSMPEPQSQDFGDDDTQYEDD